MYLRSLELNNLLLTKHMEEARGLEDRLLLLYCSIESSLPDL